MENKNMGKRAWLDFLYYKIGKQNTNFFLCGTYGDRKFTKWRTYLDCVATLDEVNHNEKWEDRRFFEGINQRQILKNEIVLDLEEPERIKGIVKKIRAWDSDLEFFVFETGSRGYHIHIFFPKAVTINEKEFLVKKLGTDIQKCSEKNLIALEYCPHWKTGNLKREVEI